MTMTTILEVRDVTMRFGGLVANERVSMSVHGGEIFAVIGPNGAGKTTLFNAITGIYEATEGQILFDGKEIRREWSRRTSFRAIGVGLATAVVAVLAYNATDLWQGAIVEKYVYAQPFRGARPWQRWSPRCGPQDSGQRGASRYSHLSLVGWATAPSGIRSVGRQIWFRVQGLRAHFRTFDSLQK